MSTDAKRMRLAEGETIRDDGVYIISGCRTPVGSLMGALSTLTAPELGGIAIKEAIARAEKRRNHHQGTTTNTTATTTTSVANAVEEVLMGCVLTAAVGQSPATQAAVAGGLSAAAVATTTINKVCSSGLKALTIAAAEIRAGDVGVAVVGGMESMSQCPLYLPKETRAGLRYGHQTLTDGVIVDGLWDVYNNVHMGVCAEHVAASLGITRQQQDDFARRTYELAIASSSSAFRREIVPVTIANKRAKTTVVVEVDEELARVNFDKMKTLPTVFKADGGTVTAANASAVNDGASALVVASGRRVKELGLLPIAEVLASADAAVDPIDFPLSPAKAIPLALAKCGMSIDDVELFEINEAFSVVPIGNCAKLNVSIDKVNVLGGAVAIGHPIGCSGSRIVVTLLNALDLKGKTIGCAAVCNGGGGGTAVIVRRINSFV